MTHEPTEHGRASGAQQLDRARREDGGAAPSSAAEPALSGAALAVFALLFAGLVALLHDDPIAITLQSARYVRATLALASGEGMTLWDGEPFARFPPLFVWLLAPLCAAGFSVVSSVACVNAAAFVAGLVGLWLLGRELGLERRWFLPLAWGLLAAHVAMFRSLRPDLIPIAASLFAVIGVARYASRAQSPQSPPGRGGGTALGGLLLAALACCVAALSRYMAAFTLLPAIAALVFSSAPRGRRLADVSLFGSVATAPLLAWIARNWWWTGYPLGMSRTEERFASQGASFGVHAEAALRSFGFDLFSPSSIGLPPLLYDGVVDAGGWITLAVGALALAALAAGLFFLPRSPFSPPSESEAEELGAPLLAYRRSALAASLVFAGWYLVALLGLWSLGNNDPIYSRYVAPIYTPLLIALAVLWQRARDLGPAGSRTAFAFGVAVAVMGAVNVPKTIALLGPEPPDSLVERQTRAGRERWFRSLDWEAAQFMKSVPRLRDGRADRG